MHQSPETMQKKICTTGQCQRDCETMHGLEGNALTFEADILGFSICEIDLAVRTQIEQLSVLTEYSRPAHISECIFDLQYLFFGMKMGCFGSTKPHLWLVCNINSNH